MSPEDFLKDIGVVQLPPATLAADEESPIKANGAATQHPVKLEAIDAGDDDQPIEPRGWLLGNTFCREFISGLVAPGGGGKTSLRIVQLLALACGRPLTGEHVFSRSRVLIVCLEDGLTELRRRVRAARIHYKISADEIKGRLFLATPMGLKIARRDPKTHSVAPAELDQALRDFIDDKKIDIVSVDPIKKSHAVEENSNDDMDAVVTIMARIAIEKKVAFDILSHERKTGAAGAEAGDADRARGAGSVKDGGRIIYTITGMSAAEAQTFDINDDERRLLFRVDSAKFNLGPPQTAAWFKLIGIKLGNGTADYPNGDEVQTVEVWTPPKTFDGFSTEGLNRALKRLAAGMPDGRRYSAAPSAKARAAWRVLQEMAPTQSEQRCRAIVALWVKTKMIEIGSYYDEKERKENEGILAAKAIGEVAP